MFYLKKIINTCLAIITGLIFNACFPEDDTQPLVPYAGVVGTTLNSIYTHQTFFSLADSNEVACNALSDWDIGFESGNNGKNIIINGGNLLEVTNLGNTNYLTTNSVPSNSEWAFDASSGNPDSLAINNWVNTNTTPYTYSNHVFVIKRNDGNNVVFQKKFKIIELTNAYYKILLNDLEATTADTFTLYKNNTLNYVKASITDNFIVKEIEPPTSNWDLCFTRYATIIPDDDGTPTPYYVNGIYINHNKIKAAQHYITTNMVSDYNGDEVFESGMLKKYFESNFNVNLNDSSFSSNWDVIGWDWKTYTPDKPGQKYTVNQRKVYIIKDIASNKSYKLRFINFTDRPLFQYIEL